MYCAHCGKELAEGANFCTACGSQASVAERLAIAEEMAPEEMGGVSAALSSGRARSRLRMSPMILLVLALALTAGIAAAAIYVYTQTQLPNSERNVVADYEDIRGFESEGTVDSPVDTSTAVERLFNGWWRSAGSTQSIFHHISNGVEYIYQVSPDVMASSPVDEWDDFVFDSKRAIESTKHYESGETGAATEPLNAITFEGGLTYLMYASDENTLVMQNIDGTGYSVSGSLLRMVDIPDTLSKLAEETEVVSASATAEEVSHFSFEHCEFDLPEYWRGKVIVEQKNDRVTIYAKTVHDAGYGGALAWIRLGDENATIAHGDVASRWVYDREYAPGQYVIVWAATPATCVVSGMITSGWSLEESIAEMYRNMPRDLFDDYVGLSSGGRLSANDITVANKGSVFERDCYALDSFPSLIEVR